MLKKKPLVLPKVLRGELSQSSASYQFVEGESVDHVETYLDEDSSPRLFFQVKNNASREGSDGPATAVARDPMQKSGAQSLVPMLNTTVGATMKVLPQERRIQKKIYKEARYLQRFWLRSRKA